MTPPSKSVFAMAFMKGFLACVCWLAASNAVITEANQSVVGGKTQLETSFLNPIIDAGADPWVIRSGNKYYLTMTTGNNVTVWESRTLSGLGNARSQVVWSAEGTDYEDIWAPELHRFGNHWYIYFAADKNGANATHRMFVLKSKGANPMGPYEFVGRINDPSNQWAIDGTILSLKHRLYFIWSGWTSDADKVTQYLYIAPMSSPTTIDGPRVLISTPTYEWETSVAPINEGPEILQHRGKTFLIYSANASWTNVYCLGMLTLHGTNPLSPSAWEKSPLPVFKSAGDVYGPGHASFTVSENGKQDWIVYHAARFPFSGWDRNVRMQPFQWNTDGTPSFGKPIQTNQPIRLPAGEHPFRVRALPTSKTSSSETYHITVSKSGTYPIWIRYSNGTGIQSNLTLSIHDLTLPLAIPNTGASNVFSSATVELYLKVGVNTIQLSGSSDQIKVPFIEVGQTPGS